ncbi:MAG: photosynthetic complex assembly protein PuhC [Pseudomonadota bacterium]
MTNRPQARPLIPKQALIAAAVMIGFSVISVAAFRLAGFEPDAQVPSAEASSLIMPFRVEDGDDGTVIIYAVDDQSEQVIQVIGYGEGGFIRGVLRGMARARKIHEIGPEAPFHLVQHSNGRLILEDPEVDRRIDLRAFGEDNVESFRALLSHTDQRI